MTKREIIKSINSARQETRYWLKKKAFWTTDRWKYEYTDRIGKTKFTIRVNFPPNVCYANLYIYTGLEQKEVLRREEISFDGIKNIVTYLLNDIDDIISGYQFSTDTKK